MAHSNMCGWQGASSSILASRSRSCRASREPYRTAAIRASRTLVRPFAIRDGGLSLWEVPALWL
jgi:hypothetical protein